jgi:uncharacterized protein YecT (DUF1311 family)
MDRRLWILGGAGIVITGALALALSRPAEPPDMAAPGAPTLNIQIAERPAPAGPPPPGAPLEVLPEEMAKAAPHNPPLAPPPPLDLGPVETPPQEGEALARPRPYDGAAVPASFDCRRARTPAERVVCADPALADADQELVSAYDQALAAGVPAWRLERQQRRWLRAREDAARDAPAAVAEVYAARIAELQAQADLGPPADQLPWPPSW